MLWACSSTFVSPYLVQVLPCDVLRLPELSGSDEIATSDALHNISGGDIGVGQPGIRGHSQPVANTSDQCGKRKRSPSPLLWDTITEFDTALEESIVLVSIEGEDANHIDMGSWMPDFEKPDLGASSTTSDARQDQEVGANDINPE
mmetsp:Transcript_17408/g.27889  ORF Transcript_17408/g.27889 Transcript_17408/m.27889 type:complete len:146 (-) Transcript_17408:143-580(-)|eukprot:CAMPEP_0179458208 /NCGR_PEP_ID=MMETSP0799-20121207/41825_1 /TAXON_ID=46947 /ORGANISM="Geminigera cryophila, Strain CCMP2564" /LENGTH=145 /DNA_ID=CAMNT_0021259363 /DNA_START=38 /DNA_END=475 /DNA_ORIENTATION=-